MAKQGAGAGLLGAAGPTAIGVLTAAPGEGA